MTIDDATARVWLELWRRGATARAIAALEGVSDRTVRRVLATSPEYSPRRPGPPRRARPTVAAVVAAWQAIGTIRGVERHLGVSETTVRARLAEAGVVAHPDRRPRKKPPPTE